MRGQGRVAVQYQTHHQPTVSNTHRDTGTSSVTVSACSHVCEGHHVSALIAGSPCGMCSPWILRAGRGGPVQLKTLKELKIYKGLPLSKFHIDLPPPKNPVPHNTEQNIDAGAILRELRNQLFGSSVLLKCFHTFIIAILIITHTCPHVTSHDLHMTSIVQESSLLKLHPMHFHAHSNKIASSYGCTGTCQKGSSLHMLTQNRTEPLKIICQAILISR